MGLDLLYLLGMTYTQTQKIEITANAIASKLKGQGLKGAALKNAIEEVASEAFGYGEAGLVWVDFIRGFWEDESDAGYRVWVRVRNLAAKKVSA